MSEHERSQIVKFEVASSYKNYLNGFVIKVYRVTKEVVLKELIIDLYFQMSLLRH